MDYRTEYERWCRLAVTDEDIVKELKSMDESGIEDAFYRSLAFGTGGLRGIIGAGTNRMNVYTAAKASQGLSDYLMKRERGQASVVIGYDSRIKSEVFARTAAAVFAANGVAVHLWDRLNPVPAVSFAVRYLKASAGVMITASHNPSRYNGYKVYGADGCQITTEAADKILTEIEKLDIFADVKRGDFAAGVETGKITYISEQVLTAFLEKVKEQSVLFGEEISKEAAIVYTPLNGTGALPVARVLRETGYTNLILVEEQRLPDGNFPTCPYPNPEEKGALALGLKYAERNHAELLLATDPDCDRVGIAVRARKGEYQLLSGNETGLLLFDYLCSQRVKHGKMPAKPVMVKTIVTTDMAERIASDYGVDVINVLTGFKFIGEQIGRLEKEGKVESYIFGFEESYGYLSGGYVRDKDGVGGAYLICEMFSYYAGQGVSLMEKLQELSEKYGYCLNTLHSYEFEGSIGAAKMQDIMKRFYDEVGEGKQSEGFAGKKVRRVFDYRLGLEGFPKSDVLKYLLEDNCSIVVRPSGTEPKLKLYLSVSADTKEKAEETERQIVEEIEACFKIRKDLW